MSVDIDKAISELLDGETAERDLPDVLGKLSRNRELKARWSRLVTVRECCHDTVAVAVTDDFGERVANALAEEPVVLAPSSKPAPRRPERRGVQRYLKPAAGLAIAASVAAVAIFGLRIHTPDAAGDALPPAEPAPALADFSRPSPAQPRVELADAQITTPVAPTRTARRTGNAWLNEYLLYHTQQAGFSGRAGFVPYVPIVSTDPPQAQFTHAVSTFQVAAPRD